MCCHKLLKGAFSVFSSRGQAFDQTLVYYSLGIVQSLYTPWPTQTQFQILHSTFILIYSPRRPHLSLCVLRGPIPPLIHPSFSPLSILFIFHSPLVYFPLPCCLFSPIPPRQRCVVAPSTCSLSLSSFSSQLVFFFSSCIAADSCSQLSPLLMSR